MDKGVERRQGTGGIRALAMGLCLFALGTLGCGLESSESAPVALEREAALEAAVGSRSAAGTLTLASSSTLVVRSDRPVRRDRAPDVRVRVSRARVAVDADRSSFDRPPSRKAKRLRRRNRILSQLEASREETGRDVRLVPAQAPEIFEDYVTRAFAPTPRCGISHLEDTLMVRALDGPLAAGQLASADFSGTNLQEANVDEADRVKFDGQHLFIADSLTRYYSPIPIGRIMPALPILIGDTALIDPRPAVDPLTGRPTSLPRPTPTPVTHSVRVMAVDPDDPGATEVARIELPNSSGGIHGLYHLPSDDSGSAQLAVLGARRVYGIDSWTLQMRTTLDIYDVDDPADAVSVASLELEGNVVASRRLGDRLILVTQLRAGCGSLEDDPSVHLLPRLRVNAGEPLPLVSIGDCFVPESVLRSEIFVSTITTVTSIDLRNPSDRTSMCLAGTAGTVYASPDALYLSQPDWSLSLPPEPSVPSERVASPFAIIGERLWGRRIFKIALDPAGPIYRGNAFVEGNSWSSFMMGEHDGVLGIMTTIGWPVFEHRLTLLREAAPAGSNPASIDPSDEPHLEIVSQLPNELEPAPIGKPGEQLHAVRFIGSRVYAVTFKNIDPLYIMDVSDPEHPYIAGEVEIPGFSDYLHPIGENLLLGVGKAAFDQGIFAWYQGVKLELFDVSDPSTLSSIDSVLVGMRGSQSAALTDSHAISHLSLGEGRHRFSVPVEVHDGPEATPSTWHPWVETGLFLFEVEEGENPLDSTIDNVGAIVRETAEDEVANWQDRSTSNDRSVLSGDDVHYIHGEEVWSASWFEPEEAVGPQ